MSLFIREKRDGSRAPGYLVYLCGAVGAVAGVLVLHGRMAADRPPPRRARSHSSDVGAITEPASEITAVKVADRPPPPEARSYRLGAQQLAAAGSPASAAPGEFDAIGAALQAPPPAPARPTSGFPPLLPAFAGDEDSRQGRSRGDPDTTGLFNYRDSSADAPAPLETAAVPLSGGLVPRGTLIRVDLLTTVDTGNPAAVLQFAAAGNLFFNHRLQIPFGTRFLGRLAGSPVRDRLNLSADEIVAPDGRELGISARAVEADDLGSDLRPGVAAQFIPPPAWAQLAPYVSDAVTGYLGLLQSRAQRQFVLGVGGLSLGGGSASASAPLEQASAQAVQDFASARLKEVEERYASHYLIPAGTECWLQLDADLDLGNPRRP